jgi:hypothetical protein
MDRNMDLRTELLHYTILVSPLPYYISKLKGKIGSPNAQMCWIGLFKNDWKQIISVLPTKLM